MGDIPNEGMYRENPWHQLADAIVGRSFTWLDAVAQGLKLTLPVKKVKMSDIVLAYDFARDDEYAAVREDGVILKTGHGEQWTPFQVEQAYEFAQEIVRISGDEYGLESLGTMEDGRKYFMSYEAGTYNIGDFVVKDNLSVNGSFDGSWALQVLSSPIVEVCENTIAAAKSTGTMHYRYKHTSGIFDRVEEAVKALQRHEVNRTAFKAVGERLLSTKVGEAQYRNMLNVLFPTQDDLPTKTQNKNAVAKDTVSTLWLAQADGFDPVGGTQGTGWGFVQAVNTYECWGTPIRKTKGENESTTRALRQIDALTTGKQDLTDKAMDLVLA